VIFLRKLGDVVACIAQDAQFAASAVLGLVWATSGYPPSGEANGPSASPETALRPNKTEACLTLHARSKTGEAPFPSGRLRNDRRSNTGGLGHRMSDLREASRKLVAVFAADVEDYSRLGRRSGGSLSNPYEGHCGAQAGAANIAGSNASAEFASASQHCGHGRIFCRLAQSQMTQPRHVTNWELPLARTKLSPLT
jgi:hypothetical protein